jgi:hypothetical protein
MKRSIFYVFFIVALLFPFYASADDFDQKELGSQKFKRDLQKENVSDTIKNSIQAYYKNSLTSSFPTVPGTPNYTLIVDYYWLNFKLVFWRELLSDGISYILFVRITPLTTEPADICGWDFNIIAPTTLEEYGLNSPVLMRMSHVADFITEKYEIFCGELNEPTTFVWGIHNDNGEPAYDVTKAFIMIHGWWPDTYIIIPAADGSLRGLKPRVVVIPLL